MKLLALALVLLVSACAQIGPVVNSKTQELVCCALYVEPSRFTLLSIAVEPTDRSYAISAKASMKF